MKIDVHTLVDILIAHRRAMALYRKENIYIGRNAIEVLLYTSGKTTITATEIATKLLHCNINQSKGILNTLVKKGFLSPLGNGVKGRPLYYIISDRGKKEITAFSKLYESCNSHHFI